MLSSNNKHAVLLIPEKSNIHLSEEVMLYLLMQVPKGRLTRQEDMEAYLAARYGVHHIWIDRTPYMARIMLNPEYIHRILDHVPMHREVSANGYLSDPINQAEKLQDEGFEILLPTRPGYSPPREGL